MVSSPTQTVNTAAAHAVVFVRMTVMFVGVHGFACVPHKAALIIYNGLYRSYISDGILVMTQGQR